MSDTPEEEPQVSENWHREDDSVTGQAAENHDTEPAPEQHEYTTLQPGAEWAEEPGQSIPAPELARQSIAASELPSAISELPGEASERPLFYSYTQPPIRPQERIPNLGHVMMLIPLVIVGFVLALLVFIGAVHIHLFGATTIAQAGTDIHYILGFEGILYISTFIASLLIFPMIWRESLFEGLQWNGATAKRLSGRLVTVALLCFLLAWLVGYLLPSPENTPIEKIFKSPGAAWLLFGFGITIAPFFEEMFFRGFLLPSLCTAYDWMVEKITHKPPPPLGEHGYPQWSRGAMIVASIATSLPFAAMHAEQTGYSIGPFLLLVGVSLVLCGVRLLTRSLASSTLVHSCYNLLLFSLMLVGTSGFRHLDKM